MHIRLYSRLIGERWRIFCDRVARLVRNHAEWAQAWQDSA